MSITSSHVKLYKSVSISDLAGNGGRISGTVVVSGTGQNLFPNVTAAERVSGLTRYRKFFVRNINPEDLILYNAYLYIATQSTADDYYRLKAGTDTDIQSAAQAYTNWAGAGVLSAQASAGASSISIDFDAADGVYDGSLVLLNNGVVTEIVTVSGSPSWGGTVATISIVGTLTNTFAIGSKASTMLAAGDLTPAYGSWVETSALGTFDEVTWPPVLYNIGTVSDSWTLTFTSSTSFSVVGTNTGSIGNGSILSTFQPANGSSYYLRINTGAWGGSWVAGDTITFTTTHAGAGFWLKEVVPAGVSSYTNNVVQIGLFGDSALGITTTTTTSTTSTTTTSSTVSTSSTTTTTTTSTTTTTV